MSFLGRATSPAREGYVAALPKGIDPAELVAYLANSITISSGCSTKGRGNCCCV